MPRGFTTAPDNLWSLDSAGVSVVAGSVTVASVVLVCLATGIGYHVWAYGDVGPYQSYLALGLLVAFLNVLPFVFRNELGPERYLSSQPKIGRTVLIWTWAFFALAVIAFLTKTTAAFSRGWLMLFYVSGAFVLVLLELAMRSAIRAALTGGRLAKKRLMLIGTPDEIQQFDELHSSAGSTVRVVCEAVIPASILGLEGTAQLTQLQEHMDRAVASARSHRVDSVILLSDWSAARVVDLSVATFSQLPVSIHLYAGRLAERFRGLRIEHVGPIAALALTEPPLAPMQAFAKRTFDIVVAGTALLLLSPLFSVIALLIKYDSQGPVIFCQRRRGYNQREFCIYKFRSMTVQEDGDVVTQVRRNDPRVTRVGALLRRYNLDELPQLLNVLQGQMSIVGPRPHAVAHDRMFEKRIEMYPRRLNVRPGITGWAQVHGHRGETDTDYKMAARVEHDLYYIDNWSLLLDLYIMLLTVVSPKTYRNAV